MAQADEDREARARLRVLRILRAAAERHPRAEDARDWLHTPLAALGGLSPAAAAWLSPALYAMVLASLLVGGGGPQADR